MGDSGEGLVDAEARLQERLEEREEEKRRRTQPEVKDPEQARALESLRLARIELQRQSSATDNPARRQQIALAIAELDKRLAQARP
jgi:hypothetical protein